MALSVFKPLKHLLLGYSLLLPICYATQGSPEMHLLDTVEDFAVTRTTNTIQIAPWGRTKDFGTAFLDNLTFTFNQIHFHLPSGGSSNSELEVHIVGVNGSPPSEIFLILTNSYMSGAQPTPPNLLSYLISLPSFPPPKGSTVTYSTDQSGTSSTQLTGNPMAVSSVFSGELVKDKGATLYEPLYYYDPNAAKDMSYVIWFGVRGLPNVASMGDVNTIRTLLIQFA